MIVSIVFSVMTMDHSLWSGEETWLSIGCFHCLLLFFDMLHFLMHLLLLSKAHIAGGGKLNLFQVI